MLLFQKNLAAEESVHRLVKMSAENPGPVEVQKIDAPEAPVPTDFKKIEKALHPEKKIPGTPMDEPGHQAKLKTAEKKLEKGYESKDIPPELVKMSRTEIRNLERENPELLLQTCFWKIEGEDQKTPIQNPQEIKVGDKVRFDVPEAGGKNKNLEMGAGLRVLPQEIKVVAIGGEKFFRVSEGGAFVDAQGNYRAVRSQARETISLVEASAEDQKTIENLRKSRGAEYVRRDLGFAWNAWRESGNASDAESLDAFATKMQNDKNINPKMRDELSNFVKTQKEFEKLWAGFDLEKYKSEIAAIESRGSGDYSADNRGHGASDPWNKRAIGRYQFTIETLRDLGTPITNEAGITDFKKNVALQEEVMNRFTSDHLAKIRNNPGALEKITSGKYTVAQTLAAMHLGGAGALNRVATGDLDATDYMGTSFASYMNRIHG